MKFKFFGFYIFIVTVVGVGIMWRSSERSQTKVAASSEAPSRIELPDAMKRDAEPTRDETVHDPKEKAFAAASRTESHLIAAANPAPQSAEASETDESPTAGIATLDRESFAALAEGKIGEPVSLPLPNGETVTGTIKLVQHENGTVRVSGALDGDPLSTFVLSASGEHVGGIVQRPAEHLAYTIEETEQGKVVLREKPLSDVVCAPMPRKNNEPARTVGSTGGAAGAVAAAVPVLNSRPTAVAQLYLDFDGETVTDPLWASGATIVAASYNLSSADITSIFNRVAEDYSSFNINVTTDVQKYNGTPAGKRMRCIITPTDTAASGSGGVAYLGCFARAGQSGSAFSSTIPCWVFNSSVVGISEAISHELGHTFGLHHDGRALPGGSTEEYFAGQGSGATSWGPIMGASYGQAVVQWSKGEYQYANNPEDDLATIGNATNGFGPVADEAGASIASATALSLSAGSIVQTGVIATADTDFFSFSTTGGVVTISATGAALSPDLDIALEIQNASGAVLATSNPATALTASISTTLAAGTYYLKVSGSGAGDPFTTGYSSYASIGVYTLSGTIPGSGSTQSLPNLLPGLPTGWSDKIVVSTTTGTNTDSAPLLPTDALYLDLAVLNSGAAASAAPFATEIYVDDVLTNTSQSPSALAVNGYSLVQDFPIGALSAGTHTIRVKVDSANAVTESSETDNEYSRTVTISAANSSNDDFASAVTLSGNSGSISGSTVGATTETGEPFHAGYAPRKSIWYRWTASANGPISVDTFGSDFDTLLAVYTGSSVGTLIPVASNDDAGGDLQSKVTFNAVSGTTYRIAVDGYGGAVGNVALNYSFAPTVRYTVTTTAAPVSTGTTTGGGTYTGGSNVTVRAVAKTGYRFSNWTENGVVVSTSATYTFAINSNRSLVANFRRRS